MDRTGAVSDEALLDVAGFDVAWVEGGVEVRRPLGDAVGIAFELVTYPETVVLTGLLASPHWRDHSHLPAEVARRLGIAPQKWVAIPKTRRS